MMALAVRSLSSRYPLTVLKYRRHIMRRLVAEKISKGCYDLVYVDHLQSMAYLGSNINVPVILDEHNCEGELIRQKYVSSNNVLVKWFMKREWRKISRFEAEAVQRATCTIVLTKQDKRDIEGEGGRGNFSVIPISVPDKGIKRYNDGKPPFRILFLGTLTWEPNITGLLWFVDEVLPELTGVELVVAGKGLSEQHAEHMKSAGARVLGYVESVDVVYDMCDCMVVPLFSGSGQRVKILEAFSKGMPVITTAVGAEGIEYQDGEEIIVANNVSEFINSIKHLMTDHRLYGMLADGSRKRYLRSYSSAAIKQQLLSVIKHGLRQ